MFVVQICLVVNADSGCLSFTEDNDFYLRTFEEFKEVS